MVSSQYFSVFTTISFFRLDPRQNLLGLSQNQMKMILELPSSLMLVEVGKLCEFRLEKMRFKKKELIFIAEGKEYMMR